MKIFGKECSFELFCLDFVLGSGSHLRGLPIHTIRKRKKMAGQNTFQIFLLNDANMIGGHWETRMEMLHGFPFEKITFLPRIDTNSGFGRD